MHIGRVFRLIGLLLCFLGLSMSLPLLVSLIYKDSSTRPFVFAVISFAAVQD
jgi:Trk-type K+ transport system membrane component